ncbi:MAG: calcium/proton exchanger [Thermoleophilaceae bacterium]
MLDVEDPADPPTGPRRRRRGPAGFLLSGEGWPYVLVPFIPTAVALRLGHVGAALIFATSAIGVIPTAALMGKATEELADRVGPGIGGLLNVTFGNFPELLIAFFALREGLHEVVKASIIGSVLGNVLLVLGASMLVGGVTRDRQSYSARAARSQATMLILASAALVMPAVFQLVKGGGLPLPGAELVRFSTSVENLSLTVAIVLLLSYAAGLWFSLVSHRDLFNPPEDEEDDKSQVWTVKRSVTVLAIAGLAVGLMSEILVGSIAETAESVGLTEFFIGAVIVAIVGNAAEHWVAVYVAAKDKMDLAVNIAVGSGAQVALFVGPLLVVLSFFVGPHPLALAFNGFEVAGIVMAVIVASHITSQGESTWFDGLMLLAVYAVLVATFLFA